MNSCQFNDIMIKNIKNHIKISVWFDVQSELRGGAKLLYVWMEVASFEIKERGGLMFKKELGGGVRLFKGRG